MTIQTRKNGSIRLSGNDANDFIKLLRGDNKVDEFNLTYKSGDRVKVLDDCGAEFTDTVKFPASVMGGHTAMMWLEKGPYMLSRLIGRADNETNAEPSN